MSRRARWLAASWAGLSLFVLLGLKSPERGLGGWSTDVISHVSATILFRYRGFDVYRVPVENLARRIGPPQAELYELPERQGRPPLRINYGSRTRPYPPGVFLYFLPEAFLGEAFGLSAGAIGALSLLKLLLAGHLLFWLLLRSIEDEGPSDDVSRALGRWVLLPLCYSEIMLWSLSGQYDPIAIALLVLSARALGRGLGLDSLLWYAAAAFLHFRALWYAPLPLCAGWLLARQRRPLQEKGAAMKAAAALILLGLSAYTFLLSYPSMKAIPPTNFFYPPGLPAAALAERLSYLLLPLGSLTAALWLNRSRLAAATLAWTAVVVVLSPFVQMWHSLFLLPLFALPGFSERSAARTRALLLVAYLVLGSLAFSYFPFTGKLAMDLLSEAAR